MTRTKAVFDWFSIGPAAAGRGYGLRSWSEGLQLDAGEKEVADKLRLAVSSWSARPGATGAAALIPPVGDQDGRWVLLFATLGKAASMGSQADATCVLISREQMHDLDWRPHGLLPALTGFKPREGQGPVELALAPPASERFPDLGEALAWADLAVIAPPGVDGLTLALTVIESIEPPAQRERLRGWCAGGLIAGSGSLEARRAYGLLALPQEEIATTGWEGQIATSDGEGFTLSGASEAPASWVAWKLWRTALAKAGRAGQHLAQTPWRADYGLTAPTLALTDLVKAAAHGEQAGGLEVLAAAAVTAQTLRDAHADDPTFAPIAAAMDKAVATAALEPDFLDAGRATAWLLGLLRTVYPHLTAKPGPVVRRAIAAGVLARLDATDIRKLVPLGLLDELADAVTAQLPSLAQDLRVLLLKLAVSERIVASPRARRLLADLLMSLSSEPGLTPGDLKRAYEEAVGLLRDSAPPTERLGLLAPVLATSTSKAMKAAELETLAILVEDDGALAQDDRAGVWPGDDLFVEIFTRAVDGARR